MSTAGTVNGIRPECKTNDKSTFCGFRLQVNLDPMAVVSIMELIMEQQESETSSAGLQPLAAGQYPAARKLIRR
jgi:hypothetical protein